ncbi:MAG: hypothetical protein RBR34_06725 [Rhodospirillaceae bacterium]|nr:hypothetical protein [Rhodospirillaceae bacterium]
MAVSVVQLCNMALARIRAQPIAALNEGSVESIACGAFYETARDAVLRDHAWNFATRRRTLADTAGAVGGWTYGYAYPSDCLMARKIYNPVGSARIPFEVAATDSGLVIYTDRAAAELVYTARITDLDLCDPQFLEALSWKLAADVALSITGSKDLMQIALTMYRNTLSQAQTADANEGEEETVQPASWLESRLGYQTRLLVS